MADDPTDRAGSAPEGGAPEGGASEGGAPDAPGPPPPREVDAWAVLSYLLAGVLLYGGIGWVLDWWLGTRGLVAVGIVLGAAGGVWLVWLRYSRP